MLEEKLIEDYVDSVLRTTGVPRCPRVRLAHIAALRLNLRRRSGDDSRQYRVDDLTMTTGMTRASVTRLLNDMQMVDLMVRQRDGRNVYVTITPTGKEAYEKAWKK